MSCRSVLRRVTELLLEFSPSAYLTDAQLSRLTRIPRFWAHYTGCPLPIGVPPLGEEGSYTTETSSVSACPHTPDATRYTSGAPVPARRRQSPLRPHHGLGWLQNLATNVPSTPDATAPGTSCRHCSDLSQGCRRISRPTARAPPAPQVTSALKSRSPRSSPPPPARLACHLGASWSHQDAPRFALGRKRGLPPRARLPPRSWLAPTG